MDPRAELSKNKSKNWFIFTPKPEQLRFSELIELADWYNNQIILRAYKEKKLLLNFCEKTLVGSSFLLPAQRITVLGLGKADQMDKYKVDEILDLTTATIKDLDSDSNWFLVSVDAPKNFISALEKKYDNVMVG